MNDQIDFYEKKLHYEIDAWDLQDLIKNHSPVVVIDARSSEAYSHEHIPGAINIPHRTMTPENTADLDKNALIVTYCDGIGCNASTKGALNMTRLGFHVKELMGGLDWWKRDGYSTAGHSCSLGSSNPGCGCN